MNDSTRKRIWNFARLTIGAVAFSAMTACTSSKAVPVTYKVSNIIGQGAQTSTSQAVFNPASVDKTLYKHQKVGKKYRILGKSYRPKHQPNYDVVGIASWYGDKFHGKPTATGEVFNKNDLTAAHKTLPLNSIIHVTNLENGRALWVRLNDRGPFADKRIIDLSEATARALGTKDSGLAKVRVRYVGPADPNHPRIMYKAR